MKKIIVVSCVLLSIVLLFACSKKPDCLVADDIKEVKAVSLGADKYALYLRTSGFNEKEFFYELYKDKPEFDECGRAVTAAVSKIHVDTTEGTPVKLKIIDFALHIEYASAGGNDFDPANIVVEHEL